MYIVHIYIQLNAYKRDTRLRKSGLVALTKHTNYFALVFNGSTLKYH